MDTIPLEKHIQFFDQQIHAVEQEWLKYAHAPMTHLIKEKKLFVGKIWGVQSKQRNIILEFDSEAVPRMKTPYYLGLIGKDAPLEPHDWSFSFKTFRTSTSPKYLFGHAEVITLAYWKTEGNKSYIIVKGFDVDLYNKLDSAILSKGKHPKIVLAKTDPPVQYLQNLKLYLTESSSNNEILNLPLKTINDSWKPMNLDNSIDVSPEIISSILSNEISVIQGPPGTGKSYLAAELCKYFIKQNYSVCVTALTNKALVEVASKPGVKSFLEDGLVSKTNLSYDEKAELKGIRPVETFTPSRGELLLSTYYALSGKYLDLIKNSKRFDLLVIEEASQAFLATFAMFIGMAKRVLVIGDYKQLRPIVEDEASALAIHPSIIKIVNGIEILSCHYDTYRLTKTRRLSSESSLLTGLFYQNSLESIADLSIAPLNFKYANLFSRNSGVSIVKLGITNFYDNKNIDMLTDILLSIQTEDREIEVALLVPYVDLENKCYQNCSKKGIKFTNLTISTVQKIQGLTVDYCIVYLPMRLPYIELEESFFNVSTSRAKKGVLIVSSSVISSSTSASLNTQGFISRCIDVTEEFSNFLNRKTAP